MADSSPNGLELNPKKRIGGLSIARMPKRPLYIALVVVLLLGCVLIWSVNFAHNPGEESAKNQEVAITESDRPLIMGEGKGLALKAPSDSGVVQAAPERAKANEPLIVVRGEPDMSNEYRQEREALRRSKAQAHLNALAAPIGAKKNQDNRGGITLTGSTGQGQQAGGAAFTAPDMSSLRENGYDPAADRDKEAFFARASKDSEWTLADTRRAGQKYELKTGTVIPGLMITGINSDLPGQIIAQVSQAVFDTATGRHLLIPQGAKLYGAYDSRVVYGQERVLVAWNRLMFPDGSAVSLGAMPGADMGGYSGYHDKVDNHYLRIFESAVLMSLISGGSAYAMDSFSSNNGDSDKPTMQDEMGAALASQLGQTTMQLLQKNLNIKPTLEIRPGYQFNLIVTKDIVFERPYSR